LASRIKLRLQTQLCLHLFALASVIKTNNRRRAAQHKASLSAPWRRRRDLWGFVADNKSANSSRRRFTGERTAGGAWWARGWEGATEQVGALQSRRFVFFYR